ncbi:MAG: hypothetical protein FI730_05610 [SAR202 cluster bacterium]|nr:hypothetical protein [SAR202 cluster bacterium]MQF93917.1 hypothetical protein [SAR202 cluster bacterium]|tara:strand:- start:850 stop:1281 length:432 start_codon:yes stop_codon:yes gene_type:complete
MTTSGKEDIKTDHKFIIDFEAFEKSELSINFIIIEKFFDLSERKTLMSLSTKELLAKVNDIGKDLDEKPEDHLLKKFVLPGTSLIEAVFRILILNGNKGMTINQMEEKLKIAWATVIYLKSYTNENISEMLVSENEYFIKKQD